MLLWVFKNKAKRQLDAYIQKNARYPRLSKIKYYPVLWHHPDIFHVQWAKSIYDWMWVQEFGIKLVLSLRGAHINYSPIADSQLAATYKNTFPKVAGFHAVSKAIALEAQKYGATPEKIKVVYSGLDPIQTTFEKTENHTFKILLVGRAHWIKGYDDALDALKKLKDSGCPFECTIIGAKDSEELQFQRADLGLENEVHLMGKLPFQAVQQKMMEADLLILSSVEEGIANVVLEAMQLRTLVLSTDCGGMGEVIEEGVNGFLVPIRNPEAMAAAVQKIRQLPFEDKETIRTAAQKTVEARHTISTMVHSMLELYQKVLST